MRTKNFGTTKFHKRTKNMASFPVRRGICAAWNLCSVEFVRRSPRWRGLPSVYPLRTLPVRCLSMVPSFASTACTSREEFANKGFWLYEIIYIDIFIAQGSYNGHVYFGDLGHLMIGILDCYHLHHNSQGSDCTTKSQ